MMHTHEPAGAQGRLDVDVIQPFQLDRSNLRGRLVRLGPALSEILARHAYPDAVARLLSETLVLAATLAAALKYEGVFTLQTKGDGPVSLMVADVTSAGDLRAYATFDAERLAMLGARPSARALLGRGYLAFTVDQGAFTERYQGIVELSGTELVESVRHYFRQSEQLATGLKVAVERGSDGTWRAGAIMLQQLPDDSLERGEAGHLSSMEEDDWRRSMALMGSVTPAELSGAELPVHDLLFRLFHEEQVRVYPAAGVQPGCRCSRERVETVLRSLSRDELSDLRDDGLVKVTCEFCSTVYGFDDAELDKVYS